MKREKLLKLIRLVEESDIDELEIRRWGHAVRIVKNHRAERSGDVDVHTVGSAPSASPTSDTPGTAGDDSPMGDGHQVASPMVGTFYRSPAPEAPAFVEVGDSVRPGQTLCILEAMKLMNELEAEVGGVIRKILVENGQPVEYGQILFEIDTA